MWIFELLEHLAFYICHVRTRGGFPEPLEQDEEERLIKELMNGSEQARNKLIEHNLRLVAHISKKYSDQNNSDDLISIGTIGLIKAVSSYDPAKSSHLATYASRCIENATLTRMGF